MAQRQRSSRTTEAQGGVDHLLPISTPASSSSHLDPAPKHPLRLTPSNSHSQEGSVVTTRRRRWQDATDDRSNSIANGNAYDPKGKSDYDRPRPTTLDKLEGWLGISTGESSTSYPNHSRPINSGPGLMPPPTKSSRPTTSRTTQLVIVHTVVPTDSLDSLALRFNTDVRTLRKANGLWPGDSVLVRKELYIPVDEDAAQKHSDLLQANEGLGGKLMLLNGQTTSTSNGKGPSRPMSNASASSTSAASQGYSNHQPLPSPEVRRVPTESLSYFPPPGTSGAAKGKAKFEDAFGFGEGMSPGQDVDHGESGVDDLLQLAEKARSRGSSPPAEERSVLRPIGRDSIAMQDELGSVSPSSSSRALEEPWKPNKWTFGQKKSTKHTNASPAASPAFSAASLPDVTARTPAMMATSSYQGWNDIPEPPLHTTAKGQVAHAFKGPSKGRKYPRPGGLIDVSGSGTIIEDLAAGLPANSGPASHWARPIAECLPLPGESSKSGNASRRVRSANSSQGNFGWAQMFSDTVRGKIGLDEALERGFEDIRILAGNTSSATHILNSPSGRRALLQHSATSSTASQRPSAELARVTLAEVQSPQSEGMMIASNGSEVRRSSGRSMHELEDFNGLDDDRRKNWSSTWAPAGGSNGNGNGNGNVRGRKNIRNVDWLG